MIKIKTTDHFTVDIKMISDERLANENANELRQADTSQKIYQRCFCISIEIIV